MASSLLPVHYGRQLIMPVHYVEQLLVWKPQESNKPFFPISPRPPGRSFTPLMFLPYRPESSFKIIAFQSTNHPFMIGASKVDYQVSFVAACLMEVLKN